MYSPSDFRRKLASKSDDELRDIVEGRDLGYREDAVGIAQSILRERRVSFTDIAARELTRRSERDIEIKEDLYGLRRTMGTGWRFVFAGCVLTLGSLVTSPTPLVLLVGGGLLFVGFRFRRSAREAIALLEEEQRTLREG